MSAQYKRKSWLDNFKEYPTPPGVSEGLAREYAFVVDDALYEQWQLGNNLLLAWAPVERGMLLLRVHHYDLVELESGEGETEAKINEIMSGSKMLDEEQMMALTSFFSTEPIRIVLPFTPGQGLDCGLISEMVKRYGISLVHDRAVALIDAVGFSLYSPIQQVTQLNSLSYSVNSAYSKLLSKEIDISFARSTTGDGFYLWNRSTGVQANVELYQFLLLILADNAIALSKSSNHSVPQLRACFHVGSHYEFYQEEGLSPTRFSYLVGDVTIELARMIEKSIPGQILVGDFSVPICEESECEINEVDSMEFIRRTREQVFILDDIELSGDAVSEIKCYLTGPQRGDGGYDIARYLIGDKHGLQRHVFNAKINIQRSNKKPIFLGIPDTAVDRFPVLDREVVATSEE